MIKIHLKVNRNNLTLFFTLFWPWPHDETMVLFSGTNTRAQSRTTRRRSTSWWIRFWSCASLLSVASFWTPEESPDQTSVWCWRTAGWAGRAARMGGHHLPRPGSHPPRRRLHPRPHSVLSPSAPWSPPNPRSNLGSRCARSSGTGSSWITRRTTGRKVRPQLHLTVYLKPWFCFAIPAVI